MLYKRFRGGRILTLYSTASMPLYILPGRIGSLIQTPTGRLLRRSAHEGDRPTVYSAQFALSHACWLIAYLLAGWTGGALDLIATFAVLAVITLAATAAALALWPAGNPSELEHIPHAVEHEHLHVHDEHHRHDHEGWEGPEPHRHPHRHREMRHKHPYVIDLHHQIWPSHSI